MIFLSASAVPPMVLLLPWTSMPSSSLVASVVPSASTPMKLPTIVLPSLLISIPSFPLLMITRPRIVLPPEFAVRSIRSSPPIRLPSITINGAPSV